MNLIELLEQDKRIIVYGIKKELIEILRRREEEGTIFFNEEEEIMFSFHWERLKQAIGVEETIEFVRIRKIIEEKRV